MVIGILNKYEKLQRGAKQSWAEFRQVFVALKKPFFRMLKVSHSRF